MEPDFWRRRWAEGTTGWHQLEVDRLLRRHWPTLAVPVDATVLVPLCGKSLDLRWLAQQGHRVLGVELSELACREFFTDWGAAFTRGRENGFTLFEGAGVRLYCGDLFDLPIGSLGVNAVYDRAAWVALPADRRPAYVDALYGQLRPATRALLVTIEYPQEEMAGPPFSVPASEVRAYLDDSWSVCCLDRRDILDREPRFRDAGLSAMTTAVYALECRSR